MIETVLLNYLNANVSVPAYMETPESNIPDEYILLEKTGGNITNHISNAIFTVQSISSKSLYRAAEINEEVIQQMLTITDATEISSCVLNSNYNFTDTETKQYRYQAVFEYYY